MIKQKRSLKAIDLFAGVGGSSCGARAAGVTALLAIGSGPGPEKMDCALPFADKYDWIYATVGVHPHEAKLVTPQHLEELVRLDNEPFTEKAELEPDQDIRPNEPTCSASAPFSP